MYLDKQKRKARLHIKIKISIFSVLFAFIFIIGIMDIYNGVKCRLNLKKVKSYYEKDEIAEGNYIDMYISLNNIMGSIPQIYNPKNLFFPVLHVMVSIEKTEDIYIIYLNGWEDYNINLVVPSKYYKYLENLIRGNTDIYRITGKFVKNKAGLHYEGISNVTGVYDKNEIHKIVNPDYAIKIVEFAQEENIVYRGLAITIFGIVFFFISSVKKYKIYGSDNT